ncbi:HD domain-containing protein [Desulfocicer vacuolatum]|nr:HD domain-containing protein [Desulfocicer vacuolatum]
MNQKFADLFFEANMLTRLPRSGYQFLGAGQESVAEHSFMTAFICFTMAKMEPKVDGGKIVSMALVHDFAEARTGDLNYVQKQYVTAREDLALSRMAEGFPLGESIVALVNEFNQGETREAMLARDADQLSFILELKKLQDIGAKTPDKWLPHVLERLKTDTGRTLAHALLSSNWDDWWLKNYSE